MRVCVDAHTREMPAQAKTWVHRKISFHSKGILSPSSRQIQMCVCSWLDCPEGLAGSCVKEPSKLPFYTFCQPEDSDKSQDTQGETSEVLLLMFLIFSCFSRSEVLKAVLYLFHGCKPSSKCKQHQVQKMTATFECQTNTRWQVQILGFILKLVVFFF